MRKLLYSIGALILVIALIPFGMSFYIQHTINKLILESKLPPFVSINLQDYHRGWFSSEADIKVQLTLNDELVLLDTPVVIHHGPIVYDDIKNRFRIAQALINLPVNLDSTKSKTPNSNPIVHLFVLIGLTNDVTVEFSSPAFELINENLKMNWNGVQGEVKLSADRATVSASLNAEPVEIQFNNEGMISTGKFTLTNHSKKHENDLWFGDFTFDTTNMLIKPDKGDPITFDKVHVKLENFDKKETVDTSTFITINQINYEDHVYGPLKFNYSINHLNTDALIKLNELNEQASWHAEVFAPKQQIAVMQATFDLFRSGVALIVEQFSLTTPQGELLFSGNVQLPKVENFSQIFTQLPSLIQQITAHAKLKLSNELARHIIAEFYLKPLDHLAEPTNNSAQDPVNEQQLIGSQTDNVLTNLKNDKWLIEDGPFYQTDFEFKNGHSFVNGDKVEEFSLPVNVK